MEIKGRILTINVVNDKLAQVVLKKQIAGKYTPISINVFGYWKDKMQELHLNKGEKISGTIYLKSNLYKGKYYTEVYFKEIFRVEDKPKFTHIQNSKGEQGMFDEESLVGVGFIIDEETGEIRL